MTADARDRQTKSTAKTMKNSPLALASDMPRAVVLLSGGLDSTTCAAQAIADGFTITALS